jgi:peptide-methionine (S)-S-oxide reductase
LKSAGIATSDRRIAPRRQEDADMFSPRRKKLEMPKAADALPGRATRMPVPAAHFISGHRLEPPFPAGMQLAMFGLGCFWGAEKLFWNLPGVYSTFVGYAGGLTPNPTYEEVCTGLTGHNEVVQVVYDPAAVSYDELLRVFWESHDPTQGMRQGNDVGTQYRSGIYVRNETERQAAEASRATYNAQLAGAGYKPITTEILAAPEFYYAEDYHQQYLAKNPAGYCGIGGCGISYKSAS